MKKIIFLFVLLSSTALSAQSNFDYFNAVKLNPVEMANSELKLTYERFFNERKFSVSILPSVIYYKDSRESENGWGIGTQFRWYVLNVNSENNRKILFYNVGLYSGIYGSFTDYRATQEIQVFDNNTNQFYTVINKQAIKAPEGGVILGIQFDITNRFNLDLFFGGGIKGAKIDNSQTVDEFRFDNSRRAFQGIKPTGGLSMGVYF